MSEHVRKLVASGYDEIAQTYLDWSSASSLRQRWLDTILPMLPSAAQILDLGCGAGVPVARYLADRGCDVIGVDGSAKQIELAHANEPRATFLLGDMCVVDFAPASFDAVLAFYSITHVPRTEHATLFRKVFSWLKPGGLFLASLGYDDSPEWSGEWLGTQMFFSHFDAATNRSLAEAAGFEIVRAEAIGEEEHGQTVRFLWVIARRSVLGQGAV